MVEFDKPLKSLSSLKYFWRQLPLLVGQSTRNHLVIANLVYGGLGCHRIARLIIISGHYEFIEKCFVIVHFTFTSYMPHASIENGQTFRVTKFGLQN